MLQWSIIYPTKLYHFSHFISDF